MEFDNELLRKIVQEVISEVRDCNNAGYQKEVDPSGVIHIKTETVKCEPYDVGVPAKVALKDVVTLEESPRLGCGLLEIDHSSYPWELTYDEFYYVIDGVLEILIDGRCIAGRAGDILHIPKGSSIHFSSSETCRAVYFTYPADWDNQ